MAEVWIEVHNLHHIYMQGTPFAYVALRGVDFQLGEREAVGIVGATGAGKSTLLQHLNGLYRPQQGKVYIFGHDLRDPNLDLRRIRQMVGLVFQRPEQQLFAQYVGDDIAYGPRMMGLAGNKLREQMRWAMGVVGLDFEAYKDRLTWTLSGGEQRKAALAGILALRPRVLALDEPTAGLDPQARQELLLRLGELRKEGIGLIVASHNMEDIALLTERVYVLHEGQVVRQGPTRQVLAEAGTLQELGLDAPPAVQILTALRSRGIEVSLDALTLEEAEAVIADWLQAKGKP